MKLYVRLVVRIVVAITLVSLVVLARPAEADETSGPRNDNIGPRWLARIDPWHGIPSSLALRFGRVAIAGGLTAGDAARLLNDERFVAAVGAADQGWGLLQALVAQPAAIVDAHMLLRDGVQYTLAGVTSFQYAFLVRHPELRNAYLADLGHMIATRSDGVEVLVDIETGRQITARGRLGAAIRAPGGGPLPVPDASPEDAAAQMWEEAGDALDSPDKNSQGTPPLPGPPTGPGFTFETDDPARQLLTRGAHLVAAAFLLSWLGFAAIAIVRRVRRS